MKNNLATELKNLRKSSGLSVAALSRLIGVSVSSIKRYEKGSSKIPEDVMEKVREISDSITADSIQNAGERIREYRLSMGLSGAAFAREANLKQSNICDLENGKQVITEKAAKKIESRFGIGYDWIMYGIESEKEYPVSDKLIEWIRDNPALRKELWERMIADYKQGK